MRDRPTPPRSSAGRLPRRALLVLLVVGLMGTAATGGALARDLGDIQRDLSEARQEREAVQTRIDGATRAYEELVARVATLEVEGEELAAEVTGLRRELTELELLVGDRIRAVFKHGSNVDPLTVFLASEDPNAALARAEAVQRAVSADRARSEDLGAARARVTAAEVRLVAQQEELVEAQAAQQEVMTELGSAFEALGALVGDLQSEEREEQARLERIRREQERRERERQERLAAERRAREAAAASSSRRTSTAPSAPAPTSGGGMACPLDRPRSFIDSWGHARSGGRAHRGTDIMGPLGIPVRAIADGTWHIQRPGPSAGLWAILRANNGHHYWYMHLNSHTVSNGARVRAGQQVGTNGSTGNASRGAEHVHFEYHVNGGRATNPYPLLRSLCG